MSQWFTADIDDFSSKSIFALPFDEWKTSLKLGDIIVLHSLSEPFVRFFVWPLRFDEDEPYSPKDLFIPLEVTIELPDPVEHYAKFLEHSIQWPYTEISMQVVPDTPALAAYKFDPRWYCIGLTWFGGNCHRWLLIQPTEVSTNVYVEFRHSITDKVRPVAVDEVAKAFAAVQERLEPTVHLIDVRGISSEGERDLDLRLLPSNTIENYVGADSEVAICQDRLGMILPDKRVIMNTVDTLMRFDDYRHMSLVDAKEYDDTIGDTAIGARVALMVSKPDRRFKFALVETPNGVCMEAREVWEADALSKRPMQHAIVTELVLSIGHILPLYVMYEVAKRLTAMNLWTQYELVELIKGNQKSITKVQLKRDGPSRSTRPKTHKK